MELSVNAEVRVVVLNTTFNNILVILWWSVLLVEETGVPGENHGPVSSHWQILYNDIMMVRTLHIYLSSIFNCKNSLKYTKYVAAVVRFQSVCPNVCHMSKWGVLQK